ncbi:helix-turn-helix domain-containing protein [Corynebacterium sp. TAE3-ERU16]|uniref:helix-turn-helix domain-containing protein n=1 Tax=Corynebacterium sp. TAE3-ERU16 TaxID=2849493 RepID=UPI001C43B3B0|nr:XRE family transcriptional regulator [Corynebacterium sp. TAE3-ERU16]MBV7292514.1 XRE family transcriptional regulator [Corynebacterium sp. TAE3-ERU16]
MTSTAAGTARILEELGPRLRSAREQRGLTLDAVARKTGVSTSTLSRLENGRRRPTLDPLLPPAIVHRGDPDTPVGVPGIGEHRIRIRPRVIRSRVVVPLTGRTAGAHTRKIIVRPDESVPEPSTHPGRARMYVLSGRLRLIVGEDDVVPERGGCADFDTTTPHRFGGDGASGAEIITVSGPPGSAPHLRYGGAPD